MDEIENIEKIEEEKIEEEETEKEKEEKERFFEMLGNNEKLRSRGIALQTGKNYVKLVSLFNAYFSETSIETNNKQDSGAIMFVDDYGDLILRLNLKKLRLLQY